MIDEAENAERGRRNAEMESPDVSRSALPVPRFQEPLEHNQLHEDIMQELEARTTWENRQATWYAMRHDGLRRKVKPYPGAADLHFPLIDGMIDTWKPFYDQAMSGTETLASFVSLKRELDGHATELGYCFDHKLKHKSNFEKANTVKIDKMLQNGACVSFVRWDASRQRLAFDPLDPAKVIVPWHTTELQEADWFVRVIELSERQYRRQSDYRQDDDFIKAIKGKPSDDRAQELKIRREGITEATGADIIVLWEVWQQKAAGEWTVRIWSPVKPRELVKAELPNPNQHGKLPAIRFDHELKGTGHYESRGLAEIAAPFESLLCKLWNKKSDWFDFAGKPLFQTTRELPNTGALKLRPGEVLPHGIEPASWAPPAISFDIEMNATRSVAENRVGMPDFGIGDKTAPGKTKTAHEVSLLASFGSAKVNMRARMFRKSLQEEYELAWATIVQFDTELNYLHEGQRKEMPEEAKSLEYQVVPNGSSDSWNREAKLQKAVNRKQIFTGAPWINQAELDKSILELDEPALVQRLFIDPQQKAASEYEEEAKLLPTILLGMPLSIQPGQDRLARIKCLIDFIGQRTQMGIPPDPVGIQGISARLQMHMQALAQENPDAIPMVQQQIAAAMGGVSG